MRVKLQAAPWTSVPPTTELEEACAILSGGVWRDAAIAFYAQRSARIKRGLSAPKGIQAELNRTIESRFKAAGWDAMDGRFLKDSTWVRVTFRHQMSLGSDILDAARLHVKDGLAQVAILAAEGSFLRIITPNDAAVLVSFEKLKVAVAELDGVIQVPLMIGALSPISDLPADIAEELAKVRMRDRTVPST